MFSARIHRPSRIAVRIKGGVQKQQFHMRAIVGVDVSDVAPIRTEWPVIVREIVGKYTTRSNQVWQNVPSEFVAAIEISSITEQGPAQSRHVENINTHAGEHY